MGTTGKFNDRLRQLLLALLIILLIFFSIRELRLFMPGLLGALTLYILSRGSYFQLVYNKKWKRGRAAAIFLLYYILLLGIPVFVAVTLISPKINNVLSDPTTAIANIKQAILQVQQKIGFTFVTEKSLSDTLNKTVAFVPSLVNSTLNLITNFVTMLFFLYYMLYHGRESERALFQLIPLKDANTAMLASETKKMVKANAIGIPVISIIQGATATLGYFIFGVNEFALWGFLTGIFAFFPVVGTMIVWVPLVIYMYATGDTLHATGLLLYSLIVTGNVDYISRITIMKKMGNVHPVVTVLGVLIGLGLFGFVGLIFGPLLVSYIIILFKIYMNEFVEPVEEEEKKHNGDAISERSDNITIYKEEPKNG
jgi:predicted PurR-regulated permease PerM